jgi:hypothetical protein
MTSDSYILESLTELHHLSFQQAFKANDLIMLFQPDCSACKAQIKELSCLNQIKLLGTNGSKERLQKEYLRFKSKLPGYSVNFKDLKQINPKLKMITPQFFLVSKDENENLRLKNLGYGYKKCSALKTK